MGLFDRWKRPGSESGRNISPKIQERLHRAFEGVPDRISIAESPMRTCVRVGGMVVAVEATTDPGRQFSAQLSDGTGEVQLIWLGRESIPDVVPGVFLLARGTIGCDHDGHLRIFDPQYSVQVDDK